MIDNTMTKRGKKGFLLMIASSFCVCMGQLLWKLSIDGNLLYLCMGFLLYGAGFVAMVTAYKYDSVSKLQPILSLNYIFAVLLGYYLLNESISFYKISGIIIITAGIAVIASATE